MKKTLNIEVDIPDDLLKASDGQIQNCFDLAISDTITQVFSEMQNQVGIESGDEPLDSNINSMETDLADECERVFHWQCNNCVPVTDECIINWADEKYEEDPPDWSDIVNEIKARCKIEDAKYVAAKIVRDFGYNRKDAQIPNPKTEYRMFGNLYEELDDLCQCEDCKNGCQLYREPDGTYYFQITGQCFSDKRTDKIVGCDTVKVWFKEFKW